MLAAGVLGLLTISDGFLYLVAARRDDLAATWFPLLYVGTNVAYLALAIPLGRLADRFGRARVLVAGHLLLVGAYLCAAGPVGGLGATALCLLLLGAFYAATDGVLAALTATLVPTEVACERHRHRPDRRGARPASPPRSASARSGSGWAGAPRCMPWRQLVVLAVPVAWWLLRSVERPAPVPGRRREHPGAGRSPGGRLRWWRSRRPRPTCSRSRDAQQQAVRGAPAQADRCSVAALQERTADRLPQHRARATATAGSRWSPLDDPGGRAGRDRPPATACTPRTTRTLCLASDRGVVTTYSARVLDARSRPRPASCR